MNPFRFKCPAPQRLDESKDAEIDRIGVGISNTIRWRNRPVDLAGLEIRASMWALTEGRHWLAAADNDFAERKLQALLTKPACEPMVSIHWPKLAQMAFDAERARSIGSLLAGKAVHLRSAEMIGRSEERTVLFEDLATASSWLGRIKAVHAAPVYRNLLPFYAYASIIMAHPFSDGNGRFARALLQATVGARFGWTTPILPLAPAFYRRAVEIGDAMETLSKFNRWDEFVRLLGSVLRDAAQLRDLID